jgi:hypothetical protein
VKFTKQKADGKASTSHPIYSLFFFSFLSAFYVIYSESHFMDVTSLLDVVTVKFPYLEICGVRNWGKTKEGGGPQVVVPSHAR